MDLKFADDIDLIYETAEGISKVTRRLEVAAKSYGMKISTEKSKVMVVGKGDNVDGVVVKVTVDRVVLEQVKSFTYLGSMIVHG